MTEKKITVVMLYTQPGREEGGAAKEYLSGHTYTVKEHLAKEFYASGAAISQEDHRRIRERDEHRARLERSRK